MLTLSRICIITGLFLLSHSSAQAASSSALKEDAVQKLGEEIVSLYEPLFDAEKRSVFFVNDWTAEYAGKRAGLAAMKRESAEYFSLILNGKEARKAKLSLDSLAVVLCHEIGHMRGRIRTTDWSAVEGEADYFAAKDCLKKLFGRQAPQDWWLANQKRITPELAEILENSGLKTLEEKAVAARTILAGQESLEKLEKTKIALRLKPESSIAAEILDDYPSVENRMRTYLHGALSYERPRAWFGGTTGCEQLERSLAHLFSAH